MKKHLKIEYPPIVACLPTGNYSVKAKAEEYYSVTVPVVIKPGHTMDN